MIREGMSSHSSSKPLAQPVNEPVRSYAPGSPERASLEKKLSQMASEQVDIPCIINGKEIRTGNLRSVVMPHSHREVLAKAHLAGENEIRQAAEASLAAKPAWENLPWEKRAEIFLAAADLIAGPWRDTINAATMLGQSKNAYQAEIDAACELIDFLRFNAYFYQELLKGQPLSVPGVKNLFDYRPLEGFVLAITPFNFTAIAGNLPATPAMLGNCVIWKPSDTQLLSAYYTMKVFEKAGLPPGVINFVPAEGPLFGNTLLTSRDLAGVSFTGSTATFRHIWKTVGDNIDRYRTFPRLVGETGGKDFVFAHPSAEWESLATALTRGAFEYQGQKCSAASRAYIPKSLWGRVQEKLISDIESIRVGDVRDFGNFVNAVIDERAFKKISGYIDYAKSSSDAKIIAGGKTDISQGYFVHPTVIQADKPDFKTMVEEIFGPVLSVFVYDDSKLEEALRFCDQGTPYALTGAIFSQDRAAVEMMSRKLRQAAGNFYINDKPTGAVVGQQPFGGARASGTNDKAGSYLCLLRWLSPRTIKETFDPPKDYRYPFLG
jgi:1-pyrroline-5-carboxylate dehydrogenase